MNTTIAITIAANGYRVCDSDADYVFERIDDLLRHLRNTLPVVFTETSPPLTRYDPPRTPYDPPLTPYGEQIAELSKARCDFNCPTCADKSAPLGAKNSEVPEGDPRTSDPDFCDVCGIYDCPWASYEDGTPKHTLD